MFSEKTGQFMPLTTDLSELPNAMRQKVHEICTNEFTVQATLAKINQQRIAKFFADNEPRSIDGVGGQHIAIDPFLLNYFQLIHGANYFRDLAYREWLKKKFDFVRVKSTGTKTQVGYGTCLSRSVPRKTFRFTEASKRSEVGLAAPRQPTSTPDGARGAERPTLKS